MQIHFSYHNFGQKECKPRLEEYANPKKMKKLSRLLQRGKFDLADLDIRAEYMIHHDAFLVKLNLKIAKRVLVAEQAKHSLTEAFDLALDKLVNQLRKVKTIESKAKK